MSILFNIIYPVLLGLILLLLYKFFENRFYILLVFFLFLGESYYLNDEYLFGIINLGKHIFKIIPGLTLYSKDIIIILGLVYIFSINRERLIVKDLFFNNVAKIFIILFILNLIVKFIFAENFDTQSVKTLTRSLSPVLLYYIIFFTIRRTDINKYFGLLFVFILITLAIFILQYIGILSRPAISSEELQLTFGSIIVERMAIPNFSVVWLAYFLSFGILFIKYYNRNIYYLSVLLVPLVLLSGFLSTYRSFLYILIFGLLFFIYLILKKKKVSGLIIVLISILIIYSIVIQISSEMKFNVKDVGFLRIFSGYEEIVQRKGTGGVRIEIVLLMLSSFTPFYLIFGKLFTTDIFSLTGLNNDIGLISTLVSGGILFLIPIIYLYVNIYKIYKIETNNELLKMMQISILTFFVGSFPSFLFNYDFWFQMSLSQILFTFLGLFDAIYYDVVIKPKTETVQHFSPKQISTEYLIADK